jgi:ABC-type multidrug transport system ATPase subunit
MVDIGLEDIVVNNLHKTYGKNVIAVDGISFTVKKARAT